MMNDRTAQGCRRTRPWTAPAPIANRRDFLKRAGAGFGTLALASLLKDQGLLAAEASPAASINPRAPRPLHRPARAKSIIWLMMEGGPSGFDLFDPKPELTRYDGKRPATPIHTHFGNPGPLMKSPFGFAQHGHSGAWVCEKLPHLAKHVDDIAFIKSCYAESNNHAPALLQMNTGLPVLGRPSAGAWTLYGLGTE